MPGGVIVNGTFTRRPGAYGSPKFAPGVGRPASGSVVGVVAELPFLEQATPRFAASQRALERIAPDSATLQNIAALLYGASADSRIQGAPAGVWLVSPLTATKATLTVLSADEDDALSVTAALAGPTGNRIKLTLAANAEDADLWDVTIARDGDSQTERKLGEKPVGTLAWSAPSGSAPDYVQILASGHTPIAINSNTGNPLSTLLGLGVFAWFEAIAPGSSVSLPKTPANGAVGVVLAGSLGAGEQITVTITGTGADGDPLVATAIFTEGEGATTKVAADGNSRRDFASIASIQSAATGGATATATAIVTAFHADASGGEEHAMDVVLSGIEAAYDGGGFTVTAAFAAMRWDVTELDRLDVFAGADVDLTVNGAVLAKQITERFSEVEVERAAYGAAPAAMDSYLLGGVTGSATAADWKAAADALRAEDVRIVVPLTTDAAIHAHLLDHANYCAGAGGNERNVWLGAGDKETLAQLQARVQALNSFRVSLVADGVRTWDYRGRLVDWTPEWAALMCAGLQAGSDPRTSLTHKGVRISGIVRNTAWGEDDLNEALGYGLVVFSYSNRTGWRVERDVTCYLTTDDPRRTDRVAVESLDDSIRRLRTVVDDQIGDSVTELSDQELKVLCQADLRQQVKDGVIRDWDAASLSFFVVGDKTFVGYDLTPVQSRNFIVFEPRVRSEGRLL